jgi:O-antigen/teichoic acid export membrane protein
MIPVYRDAKHETAKISKLRFGISGVVLTLLLVMAAAGPWLVAVLYDPRYAAGGGIVTLLAIALIPQVIGMSYDQAALAAGDSRRLFVLSASRAMFQISFLIVGVSLFGIIGAIVGIGLAHLLTYPVIIWLARTHDAWDMRHDVICAIVAGGMGALVVWWHWDAILGLSALS